MRRTILLLLLAVYAHGMNAQDVVKCDMRVVRFDAIGSYTATEISLFLAAQGEECRDTEFAEAANEVLFALLEKQSVLTLNTLQKVQGKVEMAYILDMLTSPINDGIDVKTIVAKIEKVNAGGTVRQDVLRSLRAAATKAKD